MTKMQATAEGSSYRPLPRSCGIDVAGLSFVIHHTLPDQMDYYTHRSGRTARVGKKGTSIALVDPQEKWKIAQMEAKLRVTFRQAE